MTEELRQSIIATATALANRAGALARAADAVTAGPCVTVAEELAAVTASCYDVQDLAARLETEVRNELLERITQARNELRERINQGNEQ